MGKDWENYIKRQGFCSRCNREFQELEEYYGTLFEMDTGFTRYDFCTACWSDEIKEQCFSYWKGKIPKKDEKKKLFIDDETLTDFFKRLVESNDPQKYGFTFVLTLILMRKRILKYIDTQIDDINRQEIWTVKLRNDDNEYKVVNPKLSEEDIEKIREEISAILVGEE